MKLEGLLRDVKLGIAKGLFYGIGLGVLGCGGNEPPPGPSVTGPVVTDEQGEAGVEDSYGDPCRVVVKDEKTLDLLPDKIVYVIHASEEFYTIDPAEEYISDFRILSSNPIDLEILLSNLGDRISDGLSEYKTSFHSEEISWVEEPLKINKEPIPLSGLEQFYSTYEDPLNSYALILEVAGNYSVIGQFAKQAWELRQAIIEGACPVAELLGLNPDEILYDIYREPTSGLLFHRRVDDGQDGINISCSSENSYDPRIVADSDGNLHAVWWERFGSFDEVFYSKNNGSGWSTPINISNMGGAWANSPDIAIDKISNNPYVVFETSDLYLSQYDGTSWLAPVKIFDAPNPLMDPKIVMDSDNNINIVCKGDFAQTIYHLKYDGSWLSDIVATGNVGKLSIAADSINNLHLAWDEGFYPNSRGGFPYSKYDGSWSTPIIIPGTSDYSWSPDIMVDSNNKLHLVWIEESSSNTLYSKYDSSWSTPTNVSNTNTVAHPPTINVDSYSNPAIGWKDFSVSSDVGILFSKYDSSWSTPANIYATLGYLNDIDSTIDSNDNSHFVWSDNHVGDYEIFYKKVDK